MLSTTGVPSASFVMSPLARTPLEPQPKVKVYTYVIL